jgi:opacity protein-like surface antigen
VTNCTPTCTTAPQDFQFKTRVYNLLAGPELKARNSTRFTPFVYALGGVAHTSATFTTPGPTFNFLLKNSNNSFAMALGGGLDIRATKRLSFRGSMDYNPVFVHDSTSGTRDLLRISLGVLIH